MSIQPTKPCPTCMTDLKFGYPGNDPENGPAGYYCDDLECQQVETDKWYASLSPEEKAEILAEEEKLDKMYAEVEAKFFTFVNPETGKEQTCRLYPVDITDPMTEASGVGDEIAEEKLKKDKADGCPFCLELQME